VELLVYGLHLLRADWQAPIVFLALLAVHFFIDELIIINRLAVHDGLAGGLGLVVGGRPVLVVVVLRFDIVLLLLHFDATFSVVYVLFAAGVDAIFADYKLDGTVMLFAN